VVREALELTMADWSQQPTFINAETACLAKVRDSKMLYQHVYKYLSWRVMRLQITMVEHGVEPNQQLRETLARFDNKVQTLSE
jgi:hypothetical protein